jgi:TolA-binding protein
VSSDKNLEVKNLEFLKIQEERFKNYDLKLFAAEREMKELAYRIHELQQEHRISQKQISKIKNEVYSLHELLSTNKKETEIIKKGLRSGIFEETPGESYQMSPQSSSAPLPSPSTTTGRTMLPEMVVAQQLYEEKNSPLTKKTVSATTEEGAEGLLTSAKTKMGLAEYEDSILILEKIKKNYPNYDDQGQTFLLAAQAWIKLGEYNNVFKELNTFYLKYPKTSHLAEAKLLEGLAYEKINSKLKAAELYQEVIALLPQSKEAENARAGMIRMRDEK